MTQANHTRETLERLCARLAAQMDLLSAGAGVDPVHDFRVSIRRLAQALREFASEWAPREARRMRRALRPALEAAAVVRDLDVDSALLLSSGLAEHHPLLIAMQRERELAALALLGQLYLLRAAEVPRLWMERLSALGKDPRDPATFARVLLPERAKEFFAAGRKAARKGAAPDELHRFRLSAKRFRYTLELYRPFYGPQLDERLAEVRQVQTLLGERQDCAVTLRRIHALVTPDANARQVLAIVEARGVHLEAEFRRYWQTVLDAPGAALAWSRYLARRAPAPRPPKQVQ